MNPDFSRSLMSCRIFLGKINSTTLVPFYQEE
jgi:hypothetical protein